MKQAKKGIIYRGPSRIDGKPIAVVAIHSSANAKARPMVHTYIIPDNGQMPVDWIRAGAVVQCYACKACGGSDGRNGNPTIIAHGVLSKNFPINVARVG